MSPQGINPPTVPTASRRVRRALGQITWLHAPEPPAAPPPSLQLPLLSPQQLERLRQRLLGAIRDAPDAARLHAALIQAWELRAGDVELLVAGLSCCVAKHKMQRYCSPQPSSPLSSSPPSPLLPSSHPPVQPQRKHAPSAPSSPSHASRHSKSESAADGHQVPPPQTPAQPPNPGHLSRTPPSQQLRNVVAWVVDRLLHRNHGDPSQLPPSSTAAGRDSGSWGAGGDAADRDSGRVGGSASRLGAGSEGASSVQKAELGGGACVAGVPPSAPLWHLSPEGLDSVMMGCLALGWTDTALMQVCGAGTV